MGAFQNALGLALEGSGRTSGIVPHERHGLAAWLLSRLRRHAIKEPRLVVVERISLAPRQIVALIEADGQRLLVAISPDGAPVFFHLKSAAHRSNTKLAEPSDVGGESL